MTILFCTLRATWRILCGSPCNNKLQVHRELSFLNLISYFLETTSSKASETLMV
jgi:hypothetical protein